MSRRKRLVALAACALAALAVLAAWIVCRPPPPDLSAWGEAHLASELTRLGYHVHVEEGVVRHGQLHEAGVTAHQGRSRVTGTGESEVGKRISPPPSPGGGRGEGAAHRAWP
jgi:hypothetical protein